MTRPTTSIYSIPANQKRAIQAELDTLMAQSDHLIGLVYAAKARSGDIIIGRAGIYNNDPERACGALFRAALSLSIAA